MEIKINTKFDIGQKVYICSRDSYFKDGKFQEVYVPDTNLKIIDKILISQSIDNTNILYSFKDNIMLYPENRIFETLEEAQKWCDDYE